MSKIFTKTTVADEVLGEDARYNILEDGGAAYKSDMQIVLNSPVSVAGTDINAALLNPLEVAVDTLDDMLVTYTTAGTSTAFTLTTPQASSLATDERWRVKFNATAGSTPTLNRDAKGAKALKYYDALGAKQACGATTIISGLISDVIYDGTDYVVMSPIILRPSADTWTPVSGSWAYASATTITVPSGAASIYSVGDKLLMTNSGTKYNYVVGVADTVLTVFGDGVANAAITAPYYSKGCSPLGFSQVFDYTPTVTQVGTLTFTRTVGKTWTIGRQTTFQFVLTYASGAGTGGNGIQIALPVVSTNTNNEMVGFGYYYDSDAGTVYWGFFGIAGSSSTIWLYSISTNGVVGVTPNITPAAGDLFYGTVTYRI